MYVSFGFGGCGAGAVVGVDVDEIEVGVNVAAGSLVGVVGGVWVVVDGAGAGVACGESVGEDDVDGAGAVSASTLRGYPPTRSTAAP